MKHLIKIIKYLTPNNDKLAHFYWGVIFGCSGYLIYGVSLMLLLPFVFGLIKEYDDSKGNGKVETLDVLFTILPSLIVTIIIYIKNGL